MPNENLIYRITYEDGKKGIFKKPIIKQYLLEADRFAHTYDSAMFWKNEQPLFYFTHVKMIESFPKKEDKKE